MIFSSTIFFAFYLALLIVLVLAGWFARLRSFDAAKNRFLRHIILLIASYVFYGWWDWRFCFLMGLLTFVSWFCSIKIGKTQSAQKGWLSFGVVFSLVILAFFKYTNFFLESFARLFQLDNLGVLNIILPVGISFYTFQALSYLIDVYREKVKPVSFFDLAIFISFFPQLVAGPIVKASFFLPQLREERTITYRNLATGVQIFVFGLFKKVVLADHIAVFVDSVYACPEAFGGTTILLAVMAYSLQIYFDFSGYSDMAVGCAKGLGYDLPRNFNMPYFSKNPTEFWKRWHISLSTWLGEYLYFPLGGNRKGKLRTYINLLITMLLGGLWHGANWTFVIWGGIHGLALCVHKFFKGFSRQEAKKGTCLTFPQFITSVIVLNIFVTFCWIFFRADSFSTAFTVIKRIALMEPGIVYPHFWTFLALFCVLVCSGIAIVHSMKKPNREKSCSFIDGFYCLLDLNKFWNQVFFWVVLLTTLIIMHTGASPFIYFQF